MSVVSVTGLPFRLTEITLLLIPLPILDVDSYYLVPRCHYPHFKSSHIHCAQQPWAALGLEREARADTGNDLGSFFIGFPYMNIKVRLLGLDMGFFSWDVGLSTLVSTNLKDFQMYFCAFCTYVYSLIICHRCQAFRSRHKCVFYLVLLGGSVTLLESMLTASLVYREVTGCRGLSVSGYSSAKSASEWRTITRLIGPD